VISLSGGDKRKELVEELFKEILERVGDREKEFVLRWWYEVREEMVGVILDGNRKGGGKESVISSHL